MSLLDIYNTDEPFVSRFPEGYEPQKLFVCLVDPMGSHEGHPCNCK